MNAKDAILYLYDKGLLNIDAIMKSKDSIMQELDNATENNPKYDPCRLFKKGDRVRIVKYKGRDYNALARAVENEIFTVDCNESNDCNVCLIRKNQQFDSIDPAYLELVTPVEELERYAVNPGDIAWFVVDRKHESGELDVVMYMNTHPNAKAAAEAECARLNEEWRKEAAND